MYPGVCPRYQSWYVQPSQETELMSLAMNTEQKDKTPKEQDPDFHGAALIDEDGNEIPITEGMVQEACTDPDEEAGNTNDGKPSSSK